MRVMFMGTIMSMILLAFMVLWKPVGIGFLLGAVIAIIIIICDWKKNK